MSGKTSAASKNRYNAKAYDRLHVVVKKGTKSKIKELAEQLDMSTNALVVYALEKVAQENDFDLSAD